MVMMPIRLAGRGVGSVKTMVMMTPAAVLLLAVGSLSACAERGTSATEPSVRPSVSLTSDGTIHGTVIAFGGPVVVTSAGPSQGAGRGLDAVVVVLSGSQTVASQRVVAGSPYRFTLPAGRYRLAVTQTGGGCPTVDLTISAGTDREVDLTCQIR
jgi:hypothetical protein